MSHPGGVRGITSFDRIIRAGYNLSDIARKARGMEAMVASCVGDLKAWPEIRKVMERARSAGIPYSEARERWSADFDVAMEFAYDAVLAQERMAACPDCGVVPNQMINPENGRPLAHPRYKYVIHHCSTCDSRQDLQGRLDKQTDDWAKMAKIDNPYHPKIRIMPAEIGDEIAPDLFTRARDQDF